MNALSHIRPQPVDTFTAWRILQNGRVLPLDVSSATTLDEAAKHAGRQCLHKAHFMVRHDDARNGTAMVVAFVMKQGKPVWKQLPGMAHVQQVKPLFPEELFAIEVDAFEPSLMWQALPGADVVGVDRTLVGVL